MPYIVQLPSLKFSAEHFVCKEPNFCLWLATDVVTDVADATFIRYIRYKIRCELKLKSSCACFMRK